MTELRDGWLMRGRETTWQRKAAVVAADVRKGHSPLEQVNMNRTGLAIELNERRDLALGGRDRKRETKRAAQLVTTASSLVSP